MQGDQADDAGNATWGAFLAEWPPDRVRRMTLDEYTNLNKTSFTYWIEARTGEDLGSIWGGSSFKFGVFARRNTEKPPGEKSGQALNATHGWLAKYGKTPEEAFGTVRARIVSIVDAAQRGDAKAVDDIEFAEATKWKIAFLYQDRSKPKFLPIYQAEMVRRLYKAAKPGAADDVPFSEMYETLLEAHRADGSPLTIGRKLWAKGSADSAAENGDDVDDLAESGEEREPASERLTRIFPDLEERKRGARELVAAIRRVDGIKHNSWSVALSRSKTRIRLIVGAVRALDLVPGQVRFAIDKPTLTPDEESAVAGMLKLTREEHVPSLGHDNGVAEVPVSKLDALPASLRRAHDELLVRAAQSASAFARFHDEEILGVLRTVTGEDVPSHAGIEPGAAGKLQLARTVDEVRASMETFAAAVARADADVAWAFSYQDNWVYDPTSGYFAPTKYAAFRGMTPGYYKRLQAEKSDSLFEGARAWSHIAKLIGRERQKDSALEHELRSFMTTRFPKDQWGSRDFKDIRFLTLPASSDVTEHEPPLAGDGAVQPAKTFAKNLLLYGPPGTGKTYATAALAVEICDGIVPRVRRELMKRYQQLRAEGRIAFVTFHQSYGYEEFVEGIRPVLAEDEEQEGVRYECRPGIFKRLGEAATRRGSVTTSFHIDPSKIRIWKMSLGNTRKGEDKGIYDDAIAGKYVTLDYGRALDYAGADTKDAVFETLRKKFPDMEPNDFNVTSVHTFRNKMKLGDVVVVSDGNHKFRAIGVIRGECKSPSPGATDQRRGVEWLATYEPSLPAEQILESAFSQQTIYELKPQVVKLAALNALLTRDDGAAKNHVIVIDEINRGNVSKIFGELITLLEPDKRLGADNELTVTLPHSGDDFGVPENLYVIGTMNTADRSIAFLDTALRRRFEFQELMPDVALIKARVGTVARVDVANLLATINDRIELLYDRDHTLGHAFFVDVKSLADLRRVFLNKVIPLLQEYFYGDWGKLCQALGCPFDAETGKLRPGNPSPVIVATVLDEKKLVAKTDSFEVRVRCTVNPDFLEASESELAAFFLGVMETAQKRDAED